jgi:hypothetical protein
LHLNLESLLLILTTLFAALYFGFGVLLINTFDQILIFVPTFEIFIVSTFAIMAYRFNRSLKE